MKKIIVLALFGLLVHTVNTGKAADQGAQQQKPKPPPPPTYLTPETAGQDYKDQGEYVNNWGGAQVIALGNDRFRLVIYKGGLPGAGWDNSPKTEIEGRRSESGAILFTNKQNGWTYSLANNVLTIKTDTAQTYTMSKTNRVSPTLGQKPPQGAIVLFDGTDCDQWQGGHFDELGRKLLAAGCKSKRSFTNFFLHVEFLLPFKPTARGQERGNSGVYLQDRYEIQVLDSFGLKGEDNECGGIYSQAKPLVNMCFPPLVWQTYDIDFTAAKYDESGKKIKNAVVTVKHNGILIHDNLELKGPTGGGKKEDPSGGPIQLQGHGNPVFYRNIWVIEK
ncbi:MAG: 3-keto-disaccharide hydrolase [Verrucomicrobiia bacterium]